MKRKTADATARAFIVWYFAITALATTAVVAFAVFVDPYGVFKFPEISGFNLEKVHRFRGGARVERSLRLWREQYDTIILGSSRAQIGIDPEGPTLKLENAYNASLPDSSMPEMHRVGMFLLQHQHPARVIVGLDFLLFSARRSFKGDFWESGFADHSMAYVLGRSIVNTTSVQDAFLTIQANLSGRKAEPQSTGYLDKSLRWSGGLNYRERFTRILEENQLVNPLNYAGLIYEPERVRLLEGLLRRFVKAGIDAYVFVSPMHARQIEVLDVLGLYPDFERWKYDLTIAVDRVNGSAPAGRKIALWDFSGYNSITTEPIPQRGVKGAMKWYWDSSHYKAPVGEMVVSRILGQSSSSVEIPSDFGVLITTQFIRDALAAMRDGQREYRARFPGEFLEVLRLKERTETARAACCS